MAIELCIESAGWVAQFVEANAAHSFLPLRHGRTRPDHEGASLPSAVSTSATSATSMPSAASAAEVRAVAAGLPIEQAGAVWLIDVCGCSYDAAAAALDVPRDELAATVTAARRAIRNGVATPVR